MSLISNDAHSLILAGAIISIALNSFLFDSISPLMEWARKRSALARKLDQRIDPLALLPANTQQSLLKGQVVVVGHGRVGKSIVTQLKEQKIPCVVAEKDRSIVEELRKDGTAAVSGDASDPFVLIQAHIANAAILVIASQDSLDISKMIETARTLNPKIVIFIRARSSEEIQLYDKEGWGKSFTPETELANRFYVEILKELKQVS